MIGTERPIIARGREIKRRGGNRSLNKGNLWMGKESLQLFILPLVDIKQGVESSFVDYALYV